MRMMRVVYMICIWCLFVYVNEYVYVAAASGGITYARACEAPRLYCCVCLLGCGAASYSACWLKRPCERVGEYERSSVGDRSKGRSPTLRLSLRSAQRQLCLCYCGGGWRLLVDADHTRCSRYSCRMWPRSLTPCEASPAALFGAGESMRPCVRTEWLPSGQLFYVSTIPRRV